MRRLPAMLVVLALASCSDEVPVTVTEGALRVTTSYSTAEGQSPLELVVVVGTPAARGGDRARALVSARLSGLMRELGRWAATGPRRNPVDVSVIVADVTGAIADARLAWLEDDGTEQVADAFAVSVAAAIGAVPDVDATSAQVEETIARLGGRDLVTSGSRSRTLVELTTPEDAERTSELYWRGPHDFDFHPTLARDESGRPICRVRAFPLPGEPCDPARGWRYPTSAEPALPPDPDRVLPGSVACEVRELTGDAEQACLAGVKPTTAGANGWCFRGASPAIPVDRFVLAGDVAPRGTLIERTCVIAR